MIVFHTKFKVLLISIIFSMLYLYGAVAGGILYLIAYRFIDQAALNSDIYMSYTLDQLLLIFAFIAIPVLGILIALIIPERDKIETEYHRITLG